MRPESEYFCLSQIKSASYALEVIHSLENVARDSSLKAVRETDVYRLRRGLCLPCAAATCLNKLKGERLIGDDDGYLKIGDFFKLLLPFHGLKGVINPKTGKEFPQGWLVATPEGDVYHQAIIAFTKALGITAISVENFKSLSEFLPVLNNNSAMAVSLDNRFVLEQVLKNNPQLMAYPKILIEGKDGLDFREFEEGRHVVAVLQAKKGKLTICDSFSLPQMKESPLLELEIEEVDHYLAYRTGGPSKGIIFSLDPKLGKLINPEYILPVAIPEKVVEAIKKQVKVKF